MCYKLLVHKLGQDLVIAVIMEYWTIPLFIVIVAFSIDYLFKKFNFFKRSGVLHIPPVPILNTLTLTIFRREAFTEFFTKLYNFKPDAKYFGFYLVMHPIILLRDPEIIKEVLIKNFETFPNRRGFSDIPDPLFSRNLFSLKDQRWRDMRTLLSPAFTTSKMKTMFVLMSECVVDFANSLSEKLADKSDMDMKDAFTKFTTDVIATCAFGLKVNSMKNPTNKFFVYGKEATNFMGLRGLKLMFLTIYPNIGRAFGLKLVKDYVASFFKDIIKTTIVSRDTKNITRPDMIQLMMDIRGKREADRELDIDDMTAQAFVFFFAGFETNSTAMSFMAHEIAANPDVQAKVQQEIDKVLENSNGEVTYEEINRLQYLDAVINETLRLYSPVPFVERVCERAYELPPTLPSEKPVTMKKGQVIWVPVYAIHQDEKYYIEPKKFRPERFLDNNAYHNSPCYIPFGLGPRMCIANRFALLEIKILLFHLLARCELKPCAKTTLPMEFDKKNLFLAPKNGFWLNVQRRSDMHPIIRSTMLDSDVTNS